MIYSPLPAADTTIKNAEKSFTDDYGARRDEVVEQSPKGRFARFNRKLGSGSYKQVWLGFDMDTGREIAWNVIAFQHMTHHERKRIQVEGGFWNKRFLNK